MKRSGFTILELMVSFVLVGLVLLLLARGMTLVSDTVTEGVRTQDLHRQLKVALRVIRSDVDAMVQREGEWVAAVHPAGGAEPVLAVLRHRPGVGADTDVEYVEYLLEPHPEEGRLYQLVRVSGPAGPLLSGFDPATFDRSAYLREVLLDHVADIDLRLSLSERSGPFPLVSTVVDSPVSAAWVETVDMTLAVTRPPFKVMTGPTNTFFEKVEAENGAHVVARLRPGAGR